MAAVEVQGLGQIAITVGDVHRASAFYRDVLGLQFLFDAPGLAFFTCSGVRLMLAEPETPSDSHASSILYFRVADAAAAQAALAAAGAHVEGEPHIVHRTETYDLWMAGFHDGEGNMHVFMEERAK
jgi:methylmalonyl-CoA/ethylmalonyl-CoA epimerase